MHQDNLRVFGEVFDVLPDRFVTGAFVLKRKFVDTIATIRIILNDKQTGADLVITNMTVLPTNSRGNGLGSVALQDLLKVIENIGLRRVLAVQVQKESSNFWIKNGFSPLNNATNDYVYRKSLPTT